jgi:alkanesulfonate monooxygenase SsuD/methylene tetrahydromethanopterin reductase-like flavin-dependent oxidoreductase (luciferase family)
MDYAIGVPNVGPFGDVTVLVDLATRAEAAGWDGWFVWDHLLYHHPDWPVVDPWIRGECRCRR